MTHKATPARWTAPDAVVMAGRRRLQVTNLRKLFWPAEGITKGDVLRYYLQVAPFSSRTSTTVRWCCADTRTAWRTRDSS